jgi:hypothetical protein
LQSSGQLPQESTQKGVASQPKTGLSRCLSRDPQIDPDLARVVNAWPSLPSALRAGIVAMIDAAQKDCQIKERS